MNFLKSGLTLAFILINLWAFGQERKVLLNGSVVDSTGSPVEFATVALFSNEVIVSTILTDKRGQFVLKDLSPNAYKLLFKAFTFEEQVLKVNLNADTTLSIELKAKATMLNEVVVSSDKSVIELTADKIIFNIERSPIASGGNLFNAINQAPGTFVDQNGNIMLNGKSVRVLINDRILRLSGQELVNYLNSLPAASVSSLELITNPSAAYEAEGGAILNIKMKKDLNQGFWGSFTNSFKQSTYGRYAPSLSLNYQGEKFYVNFLSSLSKGKYLKEEDSYVIFNKSDPSKYSKWETEQKRLSPSSNSIFKLSGDYKLSNLSSIGAIIDYTNNNITKNTAASTTIFDYFAVVDSTQQTSNIAEGDVKQASGNINFRSRFNELSKKAVSINIDYLNYINSNLQSINSSVFNIENETNSLIRQKNESHQATDIKSYKLDFTNFIFLDANVAFGAKYIHINTHNNLDYGYSSSFANPYFLKDTFKYQESTSALYASLSKEFKNKQLSLGVRAERTSLSGYSSGVKVINSQYLRLFPSVFWLMNFDDKNQFRFSYSRRIRRPEFWRLNPFMFYVTPYYYLTGNPFLRPADIHSVEAMYVINNKMYVSAYYNLSTDMFTNFAKQDNEKNIYTDIQLNLNKSHGYGITAYYPFNIAVVKSNVYVKLEKRKEEAFLNENKIEQDVLYSYLRLNSSFDIIKKSAISGETSMWFASPNIQGIYNLDKMYELSFALKKSFPKNRGFVALNFYDLLYTNVYKLDVDVLTQLNGFKEWNDTRAVGVTLSLNFGQTKKSNSQKSMIEEEKSRL